MSWDPARHPPQRSSAVSCRWRLPALALAAAAMVLASACGDPQRPDPTVRPSTTEFSGPAATDSAGNWYDADGNLIDEQGNPLTGPPKTHP